MATATASGVDELRSGREEEGAEEGEEVGREQRVRERREGSLGVSVVPLEEPGVAVEAGAGARARRPRAPAPTGRRRKATGAREVGWPSHLGCR